MLGSYTRVFTVSPTPSVEIFLPLQPSSALKIQDGGQIFHEEILSFCQVK